MKNKKRRREMINWLKDTFVFEKLWNNKCLCIGVEFYYGGDIFFEFLFLKWTLSIYLWRC